MLKKKLKKREITIGSWITLGHTSIAEIMAKAGFEWLVAEQAEPPTKSSLQAWLSENGLSSHMRLVARKTK